MSHNELKGYARGRLTGAFKQTGIPVTQERLSEGAPQALIRLCFPVKLEREKRPCWGVSEDSFWIFLCLLIQKRSFNVCNNPLRGLDCVQSYHHIPALLEAQPNQEACESF